MKKNTQISFSIIIPVYNCEKYLSKCIDSLLNQTYNNFEILLIDDGSTDSSSEKCDQYQLKDARIKAFHQSNKGVSDSRNFGLKIATGKYICFLDSDDYVEPQYLEEAFNIMEKEKIDLLNFGFYSEVESEKQSTYDIIKAKEKKYNNYEELKNDLVYLWDKHMLYNIWNKIYINEIIKKNKITFPKYNFGEDMEFNKRYLKYTTKFYNSEKCFYHYVRERKNSLTKKYNKELFKTRIEEYIEFNSYFKKEGLKENEYIEFTSRRFIERVLGCVENICDSDLSRRERKAVIKDIVNNEITRKTLQNAKPNSKKIKIMLIPIKLKSVNLTYLLGLMVNKIRNSHPEIFNKLKNSR